MDQPRQQPAARPFAAEWATRCEQGWEALAQLEDAIISAAATSKGLPGLLRDVPEKERRRIRRQEVRLVAAKQGRPAKDVEADLTLVELLEAVAQECGVPAKEKIISGRTNLTPDDVLRLGREGVDKLCEAVAEQTRRR
jgi:hypothetical protein